MAADSENAGIPVAVRRAPAAPSTQKSTSTGKEPTRCAHVRLGQMAPRSRRSASAAWACRRSTAPAMTSRIAPHRSSVRSTGRATSSTRRTCMGRTQRGTGRQGDRGSSRRGGPGDEVRHQAANRRRVLRGVDRRQTRVRPRSAARRASSVWAWSDRPLLPAPRRSQDADRGHRRARWPSSVKSGKVASSRPVRGERRRRSAGRDAVHPITAVQTEYSLWTRDVESEVLPTVQRAGDRARGLLAAWTGLPLRPLHVDR